jgi:hypothetical protein
MAIAINRLSKARIPRYSAPIDVPTISEAGKQSVVHTAGEMNSKCVIGLYAQVQAAVPLFISAQEYDVARPLD